MTDESAYNERIHDIRCAIDYYADAYQRLDCLQKQEENKERSSRILPVGDQKTGVLGEFYALLYAKKSYSEAKLAETNRPAWDIEATDTNKQTVKIQVKAVSAFSKHRRMTPIHPGLDQLWVIYLDKRLRPNGFWTIQGPCLPFQGDKQPLKGRTCPDPEKGASRGLFERAANMVEELPFR